MTLHLAREVLSPRSAAPGARQHRGQRLEAPRLQLSARPPRAPSPPPLPLKNELVSLLLWGWVFFVVVDSLSFFFSLCCVFFKRDSPTCPRSDDADWLWPILGVMSRLRKPLPDSFSV